VVLVVAWGIGMVLLAREHKKREVSHDKKPERAAA